ncbi:MAG TPA: c-type cytochrome [Thermoanaerobaculia bacterium]|nr:c-type cytochrome [Thermoanaerobaculia bacterium]
MPCVNCHGYDGRGRKEAGVEVPNIRWSTLTRPYGKPYTAALVKRAVTMGVKANGETLAPAMPRYQMSLSDMNDLISYLRELGNDADPGLTADRIRIGVDVPQSQRNALLAYAKTIDVYGRKLELTFTPNANAFAIVGTHPQSFDEVPTIAATLTDEGNRYFFTALPTLADEKAALLAIAGEGTVTTDCAQKNADILLLLAPCKEPSARIILATSSIQLVSPKAQRAFAAVPPPAHVAALAPLRVLVEALTRAGRDISREKLVDTLEGIYRLDLGDAPLITFGPSRRNGARGAYIAEVDLANRTTKPARWVESPQ